MPGAWRGRQGRLQSLQDPQRRGCEARHARGQNHGKRGRRRRRPAVGDRHHGGVDPEWHRDADHDGGRGRELAGHAPALSHLQGHCGRPRGGECEDPDGGGNLARRPEDQRGGLHAPGCEAREHPRLRPRPAPQELPCEDRRLHHRPRDRLARDARGGGVERVCGTGDVRRRPLREERCLVCRHGVLRALPRHPARAPAELREA
mmetsp:Transcript_23966/g.69301  ORF Transcript_23966/g.69301 Transcript_23966/m.69301 type:complete len:204 (-) Transcript_23966:894-1505(-)